MPQALILIVEDEEDLALTLSYNLEREGYATEVVDTGEGAIERATQLPTPDLMLLDLMLPGIGGVEVCRRLRQDGRVRQMPIVMLTARGEEEDRVRGFEAGADDYVTKPYSARELLLRVRAILRRHQEDFESSRALMFGELRIDTEAHQVMLGQEELQLTALEFKLLKAFVERQGMVQSRDVLLKDVWGIHAEVMTRTVDTHVKRLREKLGPMGACIQTLRGVGYKFQALEPEGP